jgi:universal stress protein E
MQPRFVFRTVLAASDLSAGSDAVVAAAAAIARATGAKLHLIHARPPRGSARAVDEEEGALRAQADRIVPGEEDRPELHVATGTPERVIVDAVEAVRADVAVLGPHRAQGFAEPLLGGTAERLLRGLRVPCLVVRGELSLPLRRIVAPVDFSEPSLGALRTAIQWAAALHPSNGCLGLPEVELDVLHVAATPLGAVEAPLLVGPDLDPRVARALQGVPGENEVNIREEIVWGDDPPAEISRYAQRTGCSLIVLGTRGHGPIGFALLGSVASRVARAAPCPVLVVPPALWRASNAEPVSSASHSS